MIRTASLFLLLAASTMQSSTPADTPPDPGISLTLAEDRAKRIKDLQYRLMLTIPPEPTKPVSGLVSVTFSLSDASRSLALDFAGTLGEVKIDDALVKVDHVAGHVVIPSSALKQGQNEVRMAFNASDAALNRNPEFLYTLFVPARAHLAVPCFDQPNLKARWQLSLSVPTEWRAVSNTSVAGAHYVSDGTTIITFEKTEPLSTYLFAFAAGKFSIETAERGGRTFNMLHRETDAAKVARNRDQIFDLHASALAWLEKYTGIPYPWGKFDFALIPSFQFGGMEHPGSIFYNASSLFLDPSATQNQKLGRASLIAHETAHMWFGDLVTMRWFDDVWTKEVFANFMAAKIVNPAFPEINHDLRFLLAHYPSAYDVDRTEGTNAIRQRLGNLNEAGSLYGAIIYQKAPIVMRQLERMLGEGPFKEGLQEYLKTFQFANATWPELIAILDKRTPEDLASWSRAWVEEAGRPIVRTELVVENGRIASLAFVQSDPIKARGLLWNQRLQVAIGVGEGVRTLPVTIAGARTELLEAKALPAPRFVLPSGGGIGYGGFELDPASTTYLLSYLPEIEDPVTRGAAWISLWEQMLDGRGRATASAIVSLALHALPRETDEQNIQRILGYLEQAYWRFLTPSARDAVSSQIEKALQTGLTAAPSASLKAAWFGALRDTARSPATVQWLERIWEKKEEVPGLTLAEPDYTSLALQLAVREVPRWKEILGTQLARIENPDRKARFAFVMPALSPDQSVRDAFFESLKQRANRQREPWVLEGVNYLHHPLRAASSEKYIPDSLVLLREIQQTGDIFFPKRWVDATLGGHRSASAMRMVRRFLEELPANYPDRLRRVILSASDDLFRANANQ